MVLPLTFSRVHLAFLRDRVSCRTEHFRLSFSAKIGWCFSDWCNNNDLVISVDKYTSMPFFRIASPIRYNYSISGTQQPRCNTVRDLGVTLDRKLDFRQHYCDTLDKANKMLGFIRRHSRELNDPHCLLTLYKSYVRSILEFSSTVWCPFFGDGLFWFHDH